MRRGVYLVTALMIGAVGSVAAQGPPTLRARSATSVVVATAVST